MCKFLGSLTRLEPTAIGGELRNACEGTGDSTGGCPKLSIFLQCGRTKEPTTCVQFFHENAWICAQRTTDHDPVNVILDEKERKRKTKRETCKSVTVVFLCGFFELVSSVRLFGKTCYFQKLFSN